MDLEVVGRHALLFDDDNLAGFVNSSAALVDWNTLSIDRYDVRHLLSGSLPPRTRRRPPNPTEESLEAELDLERYLDLPSLDDDKDDDGEQDVENEEERQNAGGFHAVRFSYGNPCESTERKDTDAEPGGFCPPFSVPDHLIGKLPPSEKVHQIIARTAMFVSKHGGQSEIVLRVKQGDNPTFGFLMPDHDLHPYFRFLVDHQELLRSEIKGTSVAEGNKAENYLDKTSGVAGALSMLGLVYGTGEDEEGAPEDVPGLTNIASTEAATANDKNNTYGQEQTKFSVNVAGKHPVPSLKEKTRVIKRNTSITTVKPAAITGVKKECDSLGLQSSTTPSLSKVELPVLEPPSDLKRKVDKIVEFILRNGKEFEAVLVQQDTQHGRFPFLLPSNQYHAYYQKILSEAHESNSAGKGLNSEKRESTVRGMDKKRVSRDADSLSVPSDIPYDSERKEKFKMVIGKSKKDGQDQPMKTTQHQLGVSVDAAAAAAILQAATKGIKNPNLEILAKASLNGISWGPSSEGGEPSSFGNLLGSQNQNGKPSILFPEAKDITKTAAVATASEADSSDANLTREQKLKAERLKRAKMFAAMINSGGASAKSEPLRGLSVEPPESGVSSSFAQATSRGREGSSVAFDGNSSDKIEKSELRGSVEGDNERKSKISYRSRSKGGEDEEEQRKEADDDVSESRDHKHSRTKRRSHHSSHHSRDRHKHRRRHSSSKDKDSRHRRNGYSDDEQKEDSSSDDEQRHSRHRLKQNISSNREKRHARHSYKQDSSSDDGYRHSDRSKHERVLDNEHRLSRRRHKRESTSSDEHKHSHCRHKHDSSSGDDHQNSQRKNKHCSSSDDEDGHRSKPVKLRKISHSEREVDLEEGEILKSDQSKASEGGDGASREASVDLSKSLKDAKASTQPSETTQVSDDLRAKIRAMLMTTL